MSGGGEYEPKDSRRVVGTKGDPDKSWREEETSTKNEDGGEYEPVDSRNVTGQAANDVDRWKNSDKRPPLANGDTSEEGGPEGSR
ncbi:hypothetical protein [Novosphingobium sp. 9U]|uniref:hypothetical protein n=1 Tax=Novosphingobium sp. 9U TaxID=2653158 RepID=UPI0012EF1149|nr:hypothetical protein [Novosphingobium sp. 9U]VWX55032.1 conserved hypothetical protein [Novosphingobium sp. 9U]